MKKDVLLLYCITKEFDSQIEEVMGLDNKNKIYGIKLNDVYGIVSKIDDQEYSEENIHSNSENIDWLTERAKTFMRVLSDISNHYVIIPMRFLSIFNDEHRVIESLKDNYTNFITKLNYLDGCEEWGLKIYCDSNYYKSNCMGEEINKFEESLAGKPKGAAFFLKKKFENELDSKTQDKIIGIANKIVDCLKEHIQEIKSNELIGKEITGRKEQMLLNCAVLINKENTELFNEKVKELIMEYKSLGFIIDSTGPWPAYNFC